jgi:hypothetical protein
MHGATTKNNLALRAHATRHTLPFVCTTLHNITFLQGNGSFRVMTKETSIKQITVMNALAQAQASYQFTAMGPPDFMAGLPQQFTGTLSKKLLSEILREALEIVDSVDDMDESVLAGSRSQGTSLTKQ